MTMDAQNRPSLAQSLIGTNVTIVSTDSIDLLTATDNPGRAGGVRFQANIVTALSGGTSVQAQIIQSANSNLSSPDVLYSGPVVLTAAGVAGAKLLDAPLPDSTKRYLGVQYVVVGAMAAGAATAGVVSNTQRSATDIPMYRGL